MDVLHTMYFQVHGIHKVHGILKVHGIHKVYGICTSS
jgi:hypothetical protein